MSLAWFPFNADAYTGDTGHLTCEEHGAYLLLMLAYYRSEKPLPSRDRSLAATCKLSLEAWMETKPTLAPFFRDENGFWHHDVIEETIRTQNKRMTDALENAKAGGAKRWAGHVKRDRGKKKNADAMPPALPEQSPPQSHEQSSDQCSIDADRDKEVEVVKAQESLNQETSLSAREREVDLVSVEESQEPPAPASGIGSPVPEEYRPMGDWIAETVEEGFTEQEILEQVALWIKHKKETGAFSHDWDASWVKGWNNYKIWKAKQKPKAKARVEVNTVFVPNRKDYEKAMAMFARGMRWPRGHGPQPGDSGCTCPADIIIAAGIDPATGMKVSS